MAYKHTTRDALLAYIRADAEGRHVRRIEAYMRFHSGVRPGTTREALRRAVRAGMLVEVEKGYYRMAKGVETGLDVKGNLPTTEPG